MTRTVTRTGIVGVATIGVPVADQDQALTFYTETLEFEIRRDVPLPGGRRWIEVAPGGSEGPTIALIQANADLPAGVETGIRLVARDADAANATLRSLGVDAGDVLRWPGVPAMFAFRDADGNGLEIVERA